jgi:hypothetical protein
LGFVQESLRWTESWFPLSGAAVPFVYLWSGRGKPSRFSLAKRLQTDMLDYKIPYWLRSGDKTHMGVPIESRNPFLDHRVVELASRLPISYLLRNGWHKWILRKAFEGLLPTDVLWRKKKMGFPFPYRRFADESRPQLDCVRRSAQTNPLGVRLPGGSGSKTWRYVSFLLWYELHFRHNLELFDEIASVTHSACNYDCQIGHGERPTESDMVASLGNSAVFIPEFLKTRPYDCKQLTDWMV